MQPSNLLRLLYLPFFVGTALLVHPLALASASGKGESSSGESVYVQVQSTKLRAATKHWAAAKSTLKYGDKLSVIGTKDDWLNVKRGNVSGFVHVTAVTPREVVLQRSGKKVDTTAERSDIVLAGKGFGKDVEQSFLAKAGSSANIKAVNAMERITVSETQMVQFIEQGKLRKD